MREAPRPCHDALSQPDLPCNAAFLPQLFRRFCARLGPTQRMCMAQFVRTQLEQLHLGTCCSGTDSPLLVLHALSDCLAADLSAQLNIHHVFSSENMASKQAFIKHLFPGCPRLFSDTCMLGEPEAHCVIHKQNIHIPDVSCLIGGFPCTDARNLNPHASSDRSEKAVCINS